jgi:hypothetical protein
MAYLMKSLVTIARLARVKAEAEEIIVAVRFSANTTSLGYSRELIMQYKTSARGHPQLCPP